MRAFLITLLTVALSASTGCMVLEEVDAAAAKMPKAKKSRAAEDEDAATSVADKGSALLEQSRQWWQEAKSLAPSGLEASIVRCRFPGSTQYMSKDDCRSRGGTPGRASS